MAHQRARLRPYVSMKCVPHNRDNQMPLSDQHSALPLKLTPFEALMLLIDRQSYPAAFLVQMHMNGRLNQDAFEQAVGKALDRNPLLCSVVQGRGLRKRWVWSPKLRPSVDWSDIGSPLRLPRGEFIDLRKEVGTRIWVQRSDDRSIMTFQIHHACCDGMGFGQFIRDVITAYAAGVSAGDARPQMPLIDTDLLASRADRESRERGDSNTKTYLLASIFRIFRIMREAPMTLANGRTAAAHDGDRQLFPHLHSCVFDRPVTRGLREVARASNATLNDVLIRDMLLTLHKWNHDRSIASDRPFRILVPTSLRTSIDKHLPASNVVGFTFINRKGDDIANSDESKLLKKVALESKVIQTKQLGWEFVKAVTAMHRLRLLFVMGWTVGWQPCATMVLANVGNLVNRIAFRGGRKEGKLVMGNVTMDHMMCVPPLRPGVKVASTTYLDCGRLIVNLRCDPYSLSQPDAESFVKLVNARIRKTAYTARAFTEKTHDSDQTNGPKSTSLVSSSWADNPTKKGSTTKSFKVSPRPIGIRRTNPNR